MKRFSPYVFCCGRIAPTYCLSAERLSRHRSLKYRLDPRLSSKADAHRIRDVVGMDESSPEIRLSSVLGKLLRNNLVSLTPHSHSVPSIHTARLLLLNATFHRSRMGQMNFPLPPLQRTAVGQWRSALCCVNA